MIEVIYYRDSHRVTIKGHAYSGEKGHDLICASASMLAHTIANFVCNMKDARQTKNPIIKLQTGDAFIECNVAAKYKSYVMLVFDALCGGFELLARDYPQNISYEMKGI